LTHNGYVNVLTIKELPITFTDPDGYAVTVHDQA